MGLSGKEYTHGEYCDALSVHCQRIRGFLSIPGVPCSLTCVSGICKSGYYASTSGCLSCNGNWDRSSVLIALLVVLVVGLPLMLFMAFQLKKRADFYGGVLSLCPCFRKRRRRAFLYGPDGTSQTASVAMTKLARSTSSLPPLRLPGVRLRGATSPTEAPAQSSIRIEHSNPMLELAVDLDEPADGPRAPPLWLRQQLGLEDDLRLEGDAQDTDAEGAETVPYEAPSIRVLRSCIKMVVTFLQVRGKRGE